LAYSGGLDTSVAVKWIKEKYNMDVIALTIDLGSEKDLTSIRQRALDVGAIDAKVVDGRDLFLKHFAFRHFRRARSTKKNILWQPQLVVLSLRNSSSTSRTNTAPSRRARLHRQRQRPGRLDVSVQALDPKLQSSRRS
jgi:argininosuccinate synthase